MVDIDPLTGLPKELLAMEEIIREQQSIKVHIEKRRYGKLVTIVDGIGKLSLIHISEPTRLLSIS